MPKASAEADKLWPYLIKKVERVARSAGGSSGAAGIGGAPSPHALDGSHHTGTLADYQAPQFLMRDGSRTLTGNLQVETGITIDGVDLGAFKSLYDAHVANPDAHHNRATAGDGLSISVQQLSVNQGFGFVWTAEHRFNADIQLDANLDFIGGTHTITSAGTDDIIIDPGGALMLDSADTFRSGDYADGIPIAGFSNHVNAGGNRQLTINTIKTDEFRTRLFVADAVRIDIGEEYWGKSMGIVHTDWTTPATIGGTVTAKFEDSPLFTAGLFANNDWVLIRYLDDSTGFAFGSIWGQVSSYTNLGNDAEGRGHQSWTFTLRAGATNQLVKKGNVAVDFGASGQGYVHLSTLDSANGPWIQIGEWNGSDPYTAGNRDARTVMGNLNGLVDYSADAWGFATGNDLSLTPGTGFSGIVSDGTDGLRIFNTDLEMYSGATKNISLTAAAGLNLLLDTSIFAAGASRISWHRDVDSSSAPYAWVSGASTFGDEAQLLMRARTPLSTDQAFVELAAEAGTSGDRVTIELQADAGNSHLWLLANGPILLAGDSVSVQSHLLPDSDNAYDLGDPAIRWRNIYVAGLTTGGSGTVASGTFSGATWTHTDNMIIDAVKATDTILYVKNTGAGRADLDVDRSITLGGTVDGVDIAAHAADAAAHHALVTAGNTGIGVTGQAVSLALAAASGLAISSGLMLADSVAGAGLTIAGKVLAVGAGDGITVAADSVALASTAAGAGLAFAAGVLAVGAGDGITVAADAVAVDGTVVRTTRDMIAGSGLTGGGTLAANRTFNVGAGDGITVAADAVAVDGTVVRTSRTITAGAGLTGGGDLSANRTLDVGAGFGISVAADAVAVNQAMVPTWTGVHQFNADIQINADLDFLGARTVTTNSTNNLTFAPGGDLVLSPAGLNVLPTGSIQVDLGDYNRKWKSIYAAEIIADVLVAQDVMATIGGRVLVTPSTALIADLGSADVTIDVKHNNLASGMFIYMEGLGSGTPQFEAMKVTSGATVITGGYRYSVTRNLDATGANDWVSGDGVASLRTAVGEGYIDLASSESVYGDVGPTMTVYERTGTTNWNDLAPVVTMGNLESFVDYSATTFGLAAGNDLTLTPAAGLSGFTIDSTDGMRLFNTDIAMWDSTLFDGVLQWLDIATGEGIRLRMHNDLFGQISWYGDDFPVSGVGASAAMTLGGNVDDWGGNGRVVGELAVRGTDGIDLPYGQLTLKASTYSPVVSNGIQIDEVGTSVFKGSALDPVSTLHVYENTSSVGTAAGVTVEQDGAGDAIVQYLLTGGQRWITGIDNSDSDKFKIASGSALATNTAVSIDPSTLDVELGGGLNVDGGISGESIDAATTVTLADDTAVSFNIGVYKAIILHSHNDSSIGLIAGARIGASSYLINLGSAANTNTSTGALSGTTGTDGKFTVSAHSDGLLYLENRRGGSRTIRFTVL